MSGWRRIAAVLLVVAAAVTGAAGAAGASAAAAAGHPKRGVASARYLTSDPAALRRLGATWAYDWSATAPPERRGTPEWVPMVWGSGSVTPGTMRALTAARRSGRARALLGFNEPDSGSQSNLSPSQAAALWPQLERTGLRLGSPAPAVATGPWLARFMALAHARHLRVDFLALHFYQDFTDPEAVSALRGVLVALHDRYRRPIWITEIGALDIRAWHEPMMHAPTAARAEGYMRAVFRMLDALPFVERYAWFTDSCWSDAGCRASSLFGPGGRVTGAGTVFASAP